MIRFLLFSLLTISAFASSRKEAQMHLDRLANVIDLSERLNIASKFFVGLPYGKNGPLGEGPHGRYDQDPLYRFDTFDCTTFVETMVSLARSRDVDEFENEMNEIRYDSGKVDFLTRNHFTDLEWIPNNIRNGILQEINDVLLPRSEQKNAMALIQFDGWLKSLKIVDIQIPLISMEEKKSRLEELHQLADHYSPVVASVDYIEISTVLAKPSTLKKVPHASIVNFVRPNWDLTDVAGTHQNISHQAMLFWKGKTLIMRHASTTGSVREDVFLDYLKKFENHPTLKGFHLMGLNY